MTFKKLIRVGGQHIFLLSQAVNSYTALRYGVFTNVTIITIITIDKQSKLEINSLPCLQPMQLTKEWSDVSHNHTVAKIRNHIYRAFRHD